MDTGLLRRLANLCKDHYVLREIDDLFVYAGANHAWPTTTTEPTHGSQRVQRFYEWVDGIKQHAPKQLDTILMKIAAAIAGNEQVSERDRAIIKGALAAEEQAQAVESGIPLEPLLSTLARLLATDGLAREVAIVAYAKPRLEWYETVQGSGGPVDLYRLHLQLPHKLYSQVESSRQGCQRIILNHISQIKAPSSDEAIGDVAITPALIPDDKWRDKAIAWLAGEGVNNQGRVRSNNVAPLSADGLLFRSPPEIELYKALKAQGVSFAPLPVFVRGGDTYRRIEPDFVILKDGIVMVVEVDGDTVHHETPAEAHARTTMLAHEGARVERVKASECDTPEKAAACAKRLLQVVAKLKAAR